MLQKLYTMYVKVRKKHIYSFFLFPILSSDNSMILEMLKHIVVLLVLHFKRRTFLSSNKASHLFKHQSDLHLSLVLSSALRMRQNWCWAVIGQLLVGLDSDWSLVTGEVGPW